MDLSVLTSVQLAQPLWLWLLLPLLLGWLWRVIGAGGATYEGLPGHAGSPRGRFRHPRLGMVVAAQTQLRNRVRRQLGLLPVIALACVILALAQPQRIGAQLPEPAQRRDLVFIVDNSVAMNLRDYVLESQRVDRLAVLKGVLGRFVEQLQGERISIVLYADEAHTLVPLTYDHRLVHHLLARLETGLAGRSNAMGDAVALAVKEAGDSDARRRVLVLFSSAARPTGTIEPLDAARLAAQQQLPLYTVAIGAGSAAAAEQRSSGLIYDPSDRARLQTMARITGARSFVATDTGELQAAIAAIERLESEPVSTEPRYRLQPLYQWPLALGMLILTLAQFGALRERRT